VIFPKNKSFSKIFCVIYSISSKLRQILLTQIYFLKIFSSVKNRGDDHHHDGKSAAKHGLIDRLQS